MLVDKQQRRGSRTLTKEGVKGYLLYTAKKENRRRVYFLTEIHIVTEEERKKC